MTERIGYKKVRHELGRVVETNTRLGRQSVKIRDRAAARIELRRRDDKQGLGGRPASRAAQGGLGALQEGKDAVAERHVDPAAPLRVLLVRPLELRPLRCRLHKHECHHARRHLGVRHQGRVHDSALLRAAKKDLLVVVIEASDDSRLVLGNGCGAGGSTRQIEDSAVKVAPQQHAAVGDFVDGLAKLALDGEDAACHALVGLLPFALALAVNTVSINEQLLDLKGGGGLVGNHYARGQ